MKLQHYEEYEHDEIEALMEEPPNGFNHGRKASVIRTDHDGENGTARMVNLATPGRRAFLRESGWVRDDGKTHRGVLHPAEYVDKPALQAMVEDALGYTYEQIRSVYETRGGGLPLQLRQLRDEIDARLLALSRSGGNMLALARILGWPIDKSRGVGGSHSGPRCKKMERAIARARQAEAEA